MGFYDMSVFCLHCYLNGYKDMVCKGKFQQGANIVLDAKRVAHIFHSLSTFHIIRAMSISGYAIVAEVPNPNKYREVCLFILYVSILHIIMPQIQSYFHFVV